MYTKSSSELKLNAATLQPETCAASTSTWPSAWGDIGLDRDKLPIYILPVSHKIRYRIIYEVHLRFVLCGRLHWWWLHAVRNHSRHSWVTPCTGPLLCVHCMFTLLQAATHMTRTSYIAPSTKAEQDTHDGTISCPCRIHQWREPTLVTQVQHSTACSEPFNTFATSIICC